MKKILFFDYWSNGIRNFAPLLGPLRDAGFDCTLLHLGSWRDPAIPDEEVLETLPCRDIRYYGGNLKRALRQEKPDVLLGLNFSEMMDRVVRRTCYGLGIPTVYMMHGVRSTGDMLVQMARNTNRHWSPVRRLAKVPKYIGITGRYFSSILDSKPADIISSQPYRYILQLLTAPGNAVHMPAPAWDLAWDRTLVYSHVYREQFIHQFGFPAESVIVIGDPELDICYRLWNSPDCARVCREYLATVGVPGGQECVLYVEEALVEQGIPGFAEEDRQREIREVHQAVNRAGMHLVVKMHPGANPRATLHALQGRPGITVLCNAELPKLVWSAAAVVAHYSTVCLMPAALGRPILQPNWAAPFKAMPAGLFSPIAEALSSPAELESRLRQTGASALRPATPEAEQFRRDFISVYDGHAVRRIVAAVCDLAEPNHRAATQRSCRA